MFILQTLVRAFLYFCILVCFDLCVHSFHYMKDYPHIITAIVIFLFAGYLFI